MLRIRGSTAATTPGFAQEARHGAFNMTKTLHYGVLNVMNVPIELPPLNTILYGWQYPSSSTLADLKRESLLYAR